MFSFFFSDIAVFDTLQKDSRFSIERNIFIIVEFKCTEYGLSLEHVSIAIVHS